MVVCPQFRARFEAGAAGGIEDRRSRIERLELRPDRRERLVPIARHIGVAGAIVAQRMRQPPLLLKIMIRNTKDGVMIPIPQYPLYSATIPLVGGTPVSYYLNEEQGWGLDTRDLDRSYEQAVKNGVLPRKKKIFFL